MSEPTKGVWSYSTDTHEIWTETTGIAYVYCDEEEDSTPPKNETDANGFIMAASKDLLAACEMQVAYEEAVRLGLSGDWDAVVNLIRPYGYKGDVRCESFIRRFCDAAIKKARNG